MNKRTARRMVAATAFAAPGVLGGVALASPAIVTPSPHSTVGGRAVTVFARFSASRPVASVRLFADGRAVAERAFRPAGTAVEASFSWDASAFSAGAHVLTLKSYDAAGRVVNTQTVPVNVLAAAPGEDKVPPQVAIMDPAPGEKVQGVFDVKVLATDDSGEAPYVSFFVDSELRAVGNRQPYSYKVDTTEYANGKHTLEALAYDAAHNKGTSTPITIEVNNVGGATQLNDDVNSGVPAPVAEAPKPTAEPLPVVAAKPVAPTAAVAKTTAALRPTIAPKPAKPAVTAAAPIARPAIAKAAPAPKPVAQPKLAAAPKPAVVKAAPAPEVAAEAPAPKPVRIARAPIAKPAPAPAVKPAPAAKPVAKPIVTAAPRPVAKPAPKPIAKAVPQPTPRPAVVAAAPAAEADIVLRMDGDQVLEATPVRKPAKAMVAQAPRVEVGNPSHASALPHPTAKVVHAAPAPKPAPVAKPAPKPSLTPAVIPALPKDKAAGGKILHAVRPGETVASVSHHFGVPAKRIASANAVRRSGHLTVGRVLHVPSAIRIAVNDQPVQFDVAPRLLHGLTMAAFRQVYQANGGTVTWDAKTRSVHAKGGGADIVLHVGSRTAIVNGSMVALDAPVRIERGRAIVPVRFLARALSLKSDYDEATGNLELRRV